MLFLDEEGAPFRGNNLFNLVLEVEDGFHHFVGFGVYNDSLSFLLFIPISLGINFLVWRKNLITLV